MKSHFAMFAGYNRWANRRLYGAAELLSDSDYRIDRGAFFGSVHRTLNHLLVADRIWMRRLTGEGVTYSSLEFIVSEDFADLQREREAEDERIVGWVDSLDEAALAKRVTYRTITAPTEITQQVGAALAHVFNHQTHHRGQVHGLLTAIAGRAAAPSLDLILFQRETGGAL